MSLYTSQRATGPSECAAREGRVHFFHFPPPAPDLFGAYGASLPAGRVGEGGATCIRWAGCSGARRGESEAAVPTGARTIPWQLAGKSGVAKNNVLENTASKR